MKTSCFFALFVLFSVQLYAQSTKQVRAYDPHISVLTPYKTTYDPKLKKEIDAEGKKFKQTLKDHYPDPASLKDPSMPENIRLMITDQAVYAQKVDFTNMLALGSAEILAYWTFEKLPTALIEIRDLRWDGTDAGLQAITAKSRCQYILNFTSQNFSIKNGQRIATARAQFYNVLTKKLEFNEEFSGDAVNHGYEFTCDSGSWTCTINNVMSAALPKVLDAVVMSSPLLSNERNVAQSRAEVLVRDYLSRAVDTAFVNGIIPPTDTTIVHTSIYQCLIDSSRQKFMAFYAEKVAGVKSDREVNVQLDNKASIENALSATTQVYSHIVYGMNYKAKWYYKKANINYFEGDDLERRKVQFFNNLQQWNFFVEGSTEFNPEFWETGFFSKVHDLSKDSSWKEHDEAGWKRRVEEDKEYFGIHELVADELRESKRAAGKLADSLLYQRTFLPLYNRRVSTGDQAFTRFDHMNNTPVFIYARDRRVCINPVMVSDAQGGHTLHYYASLSGNNDLYEWTYFEPKVLQAEEWHFGGDVIDQLQSITQWDFSYETLDDPKFWDSFVLARQGETYTYLKKLQP